MTMQDVERLEREFDAVYHRPGFPRDDFENGVARGLGLALGIVRKSSLSHEMKRSLNRLEALEARGVAPWQLARAT
jgi:hypothetical protein